MIVLSVSTTQLYLITTCEEPKDAWDTLKKHFERQTLANKVFLKKQYFRKEMKEGTPIDVHLKDMKELTNKLASIGAPIAEEDQVVTLLGSLPQSYSTIVTALGNIAEPSTYFHSPRAINSWNFQVIQFDPSSLSMWTDHFSSILTVVSRYQSRK